MTASSEESPFYDFSKYHKKSTFFFFFGGPKNWIEGQALGHRGLAIAREPASHHQGAALSSSSLHSHSRFLLLHPGRQQVMAPATHVGSPDGIWGFWPWPGPAPAVMGIWE